MNHQSKPSLMFNISVLIFGVAVFSVVMFLFATQGGVIGIVIGLVSSIVFGVVTGYFISQFLEKLRNRPYMGGQLLVIDKNLEMEKCPRCQKVRLIRGTIVSLSGHLNVGFCRDCGHFEQSPDQKIELSPQDLKKWR